MGWCSGGVRRDNDDGLGAGRGAVFFVGLPTAPFSGQFKRKPPFCSTKVRLRSPVLDRIMITLGLAKQVFSQREPSSGMLQALLGTAGSGMIISSPSG
jgi:hypothetical protein